MRPIKEHSKSTSHTTSVFFCIREWLWDMSIAWKAKIYRTSSPYRDEINKEQERRGNTKGFTYTKTPTYAHKKENIHQWVTNACMIRKSLFSTCLVLWSCQPWPSQDRDRFVLRQAATLPTSFCILYCYRCSRNSFWSNFLSFMIFSTLL